MAKEIKFNIKLAIDGKEQLAVATTTTKELGRHFGAARKKAGELDRQRLSNLVQGITAAAVSLRTLSDGLNAAGDKLKAYNASFARTAQLTGLSGEELREVRNRAQAVADTFGEDFGEVMRAANSLSKSFGVSAAEALRLVQDGLVGGANANGEFIDTLKEYPRYFREAGIGAEEFVAITANAAKQGIFSDKGVDAIKEGNLRIREMTTATAAALDGIGIASDDVKRRLEEGSATTFDIMREVGAKLRELPASASAVGTAIADIFGGPGEDAGLEYLRSLADIELSMGNVTESADEYSRQLGEQADRQAEVADGLSGIIDLTRIYESLAPALNVSAQVGATLSGISAAAAAFKSLNLSMLAATARTKLLTAAATVWRTVANFVTGANTAVGASAGAAATGLTAMQMALRALMIATGVGAAIAALTAIIGALATTTEKATETTNHGAEAEDAYTRAAAEAQTAIDADIKKLKELIDAKKDTTEAVAELNEKYADSFGVHKTAADWYDTLTKKSKIYAKQLGYEAQMRMLNTKIAELTIKNDLDKQKQADMEKAGTAKEKESYRTYTTGYGQAFTVKINGGGDTKEYAGVKAAIEQRDKELAELQKMLDAAQGRSDALLKQLGGGGGKPAKTTPTATATATSGGTEQKKTAAASKELAEALLSETRAAAATKEELGELGDVVEYAGMSVEQYEKAIAGLEEQQGKSTTAEQYRKWQDEIDGLRQRLADLKGETEQVEQAADPLKEYADEVERLRGLTSAAFELEIKDMGVDALTAKIKELEKLLANTPDTDPHREQIEKLIGTYRQWRATAAKSADTLLAGWDDIKGVGSGISSITSALDGNKNAWESLTSVVDGFIQIVQSLASIVAIIDTLSTAFGKSGAAGQKQGQSVEGAGESIAATAVDTAVGVAANAALTKSYLKLAAAEFYAAHASVPFAGAGIAAGFIAEATASIAALNAVPLAKGGVVSGTTLALVGEYAGASHNPEVVAPLDKLRSMIQPTAVMAGGVDFRIEGKNLVGVMENYSRISAKSGRRT